MQRKTAVPLRLALHLPRHRVPHAVGVAEEGIAQEHVLRLVALFAATVSFGNERAERRYWHRSPQAACASLAAASLAICKVFATRATPRTGALDACSTLYAVDAKCGTFTI